MVATNYQRVLLKMICLRYIFSNRLLKMMTMMAVTNVTDILCLSVECLPESKLKMMEMMMKIILIIIMLLTMMMMMTTMMMWQ